MSWKQAARPAAAFLAVGVVLLTLWGLQRGSSGGPTPGAGPPTSPHSSSSSSPDTSTATGSANKAYVAPPFRNPLPGMPPVVGNDVYSQTRAGMLSPQVRHDPELLYVPDSDGSTVTVISQRTHQIVRVIPVGYLSQHVVPSYDLKTLYTNSSVANQLIEINPRTGLRGRAISMPRPYNLYFTPDGKTAVVMIEEYDTIRFADPHTWKTIDDLKEPGCLGPNHADFSGNGRFFVVTCEFSGELLKIGTLSHQVEGVIHFDPQPTAPHADPMTMGKSVPQDVRISPDGTTFYVADMGTNELRLIDAKTFKQVGVIGMPRMPHGIYPSRDGTRLYVSDRGAGEVSVLDPASNKIVDTWVIPGGGSPDMGGVSADGRTLWLSGRNDGVVYGFDTATGHLIAKIPVGGSPHGIAVWPQPGRYSLGHTGNMR
ncbi:beta-propeller fold lactonase family protein [Nocardioides cynanchi]|uniref:YVTN family beta-propeller repeat protein n=1 Tax=Nocardioides cynanchi TaxID=2558918 RepID=UPI00192DCCDF|nr:beta-propeller fold lactonase family protein [Nocardioides cynanchi]